MRKRLRLWSETVRQTALVPKPTRAFAEVWASTTCAFLRRGDWNRDGGA